jgi:lipopolysaccharide/colanic/teichoic acid biosynthesis glycosyltransferase
MTGLAQVAGRNTVGWDQRLEADARYVEGMSFGGDLRILADSLWLVLTRRGTIADPGGAMADLDAERARGSD